MGIVILVLQLLNRSLRTALTDRYGTSGRATFWLAFFNVILILVPFGLALGERTETDGWHSAVLQICSQLESSLVGFSVSLLIVGWVLARYALQEHLVSSGK
jgi:hypothetical protein